MDFSQLNYYTAVPTPATPTPKQRPDSLHEPDVSPAAPSARRCGPLSDALRADAFLEGDAGFLAGLDESHLNRLAYPIMILTDDANDLAVIIETAPQSGVEHQRSDRYLTSNVLPSIAFGKGHNP